MFVVHTKVPVDPDERSTAEASARRVAEATREEPGVVAYDAAMAVDRGDPVLHFVEQFEDAEALEEHTETEHYARFNEELTGYVDGEMKTVQFEVAESWTATFGVDDL